MNPTLQWDLSQWQAAAKALSAESSRTLPDFLNGQALFVASQAIKNTEKANAEKIAFQLGRIGYTLKDVKRRKTGQMYKKKDKMLVAEDSLAARILLWRKANKLPWGVKGGTMEERVRNFINSRMRSVAFIRSGWIPAIKKLSGVVRWKPKGVSSAGARQYGKEKGKAIPAAWTWNSPTFTTIINSAIMDESRAPSVKHNPMKIAEEGLQRALREGVFSMIQRLQTIMEQQARKYSAK